MCVTFLYLVWLFLSLLLPKKSFSFHRHCLKVGNAPHKQTSPFCKDVYNMAHFCVFLKTEIHDLPLRFTVLFYTPTHNRSNSVLCVPRALNVGILEPYKDGYVGISRGLFGVRTYFCFPLKVNSGSILSRVQAP